jgi:hypothetical protein
MDIEREAGSLLVVPCAQTTEGKEIMSAPHTDYQEGAVSVVNPQGTEETGNDRPAAPISVKPRDTPCPTGYPHMGFYFCKLCGLDLTPDIPWADGPGRGL